MRIKSNTFIDGVKAINWLLNWPHCGQHEVFGQNVYVLFKQLENDLLILISNHIKPKFLSRLYRLRWGIEMFFSHSKSRGLNWEESRVSKAQHIQALTGVVALTFVISHLWGLRRHKDKPIHTKNMEEKLRVFFDMGLTI